MNPYLALILGVAGSIVATRAGAWYGARRARREIESTEAGTAQTLVNTAMSLLQPYEARINRLEQREHDRRQTIRRLHTRIDSLQGHVDSLEGHVDLLELRLDAAGAEIPPRPRPEEPPHG